jgi:hypothetical protein
MKTTNKQMVLCAITALIGSATSALAASGSESGGNGILIVVFLAFGALVVVFQLVPGLVLFFSMVKGLFVPGVKEKATIAGKENGKHS